ncbi:MAG: hypothetical protein AB7I33_07855 [Gemmatimonadales bacterium]
MPGGLAAQAITWRSRGTFYADNTEFFNPFRIGETILGAQFSSYLDVGVTRRTSVRAGLFADHRYGSGEFLDPVKPVISFRYRTETSLGVLGTLETVDRHGYLEPLQVTTLEFTRPVEYGGQWIERRKHVDAEAYLNWQKLNTPTSREVFDYGILLRVRPVAPLELEYQLHGLHHGGQLYSAGVPVTNNVVAAYGARVTHEFPVVGQSSLAGFYLTSTGEIDPNAPAGRPDRGHGTYLRASIHPGGFELFGIYWAGRDFLSNEGDPNYNSLGADSTFFRSRRRYKEIGIVRRARIDGTVDLDAEFRFHRIDNEQSQAFFGTRWEYSYRLVVRVPVDIALRR